MTELWSVSIDGYHLKPVFTSIEQVEHFVNSIWDCPPDVQLLSANEAAHNHLSFQDYEWTGWNFYPVDRPFFTWYGFS